MKRISNSILAVGLIIAVFAVGCAQGAPNSQSAIDTSKTKGTVEQQVKYLVGQANSFINSEKFDEAIKVAQYILNELDNNSLEAKNILAKAQEELKKVIENKAKELKAGAENKLNEITGGLGK